MSAPTNCESERLVAYLYGEDDPAERRAMEAHLSSCGDCTRELGELRGVRQHLERWEAPEVDLGFRIQREPLVPPPPPARTWWTPPAWAQALAAVLVLTVGAALANVDVRYGGFALRIGWDPRPTAAVAENPGALQRDAQPGSTSDAAAWRAELDEVAERLRAEIAAVGSATEARPAPASAPVAVDRDALVGQMRALIAESERRQQRELAFRLAQVAHDLERQRQNDLVRIDQSFGQLEGFTGAEAARQRELLNYLMRVSSQPR